MNHHNNSPSSLYRRANCPASATEEAGMPETTNEFAEEGTALHEAVWMDDRSEFTADQQLLLEVVDDCMKDIGITHGISEWHGEERLNIRLVSTSIYGYADAYGVNDKNEAVVIDFKFGYNDVGKVANSHQLCAYALGVHQLTGADTVTACIIQPRVSFRPSMFTFSDFNTIEYNLFDIISDTELLSDKKEAGDWCTYCKARDKCEAVQELEISLVEMDPQEITVANADDMYEKACLVEKKLKAIKAQCKQITIDAGGVAGRLQIKEKNGARYIPDLQKAFESVQGIMDVGEFLGHCSASIGKLEDAVSRKLKDANTVRTIKAGKTLFNEMVTVEHKPSTQEIKLNK